MRRPFFRSATLSWYIELENGTQFPLGKDERFKTAPKAKPKEPPPAIQKKYLAIMQRAAEPEDRSLSFCMGEYVGSLAECTNSTRYRAKYFLERFQAATGDIKVAKLKGHHIAAALKGKDWKPNTVHAFISSIHACLNYCERKDWIAKNALRGKSDKPMPQRREEIMSAEDRVTAGEKT